MARETKSESPSRSYRIFLVEDHALMRAGLKQLLSLHSEFTVVGEAGTGEDFFSKAKVIAWDLLIIDLSMPGISGIEIIKKVSENFSEKKILVLTLHDAEEYLKLAFKNGASGYALKNDSPEDLIWAVNEVRKGNRPISRKLKEAMFDRKFMEISDKQPLINVLSPREIEVLKELTAGKRTREIARNLDISERTVEKHRANIMVKLQTDNLATLVKLAIDNGLA